MLKVLWIKYDKFHESFAQDQNPDDSVVMSLSQNQFMEVFSEQKPENPKTKPNWYQIPIDHMIPPATQKEMAERMDPRRILHLDASHASLATHPKEVTDLIKEAVSVMY